MKIVLSGVETNNKGAELMLYAILQEIERNFPDAVVYISRSRVFHGLETLKTSVKLRYFPCEEYENKYKLGLLYWLLHLPYKYMPHVYSMGKIDYYIDGSGFVFSDQFRLSRKFASTLGKLLKTYRNQGTKIVFLPQAFGPFERLNTKRVVSTLNQASLIMPRERVSYKYIKESGLVNMDKVKLFTDFTSLVDGVFPAQFHHLKGGICIIPNSQMIRKGAISMDDYLAFLEAIISRGKESGYIVYLLNHEGEKDEQLCKELVKSFSEKVEIVTNINALEVKGLIASAYLVVSSRFHGIVSSLNSCVPCLATSWSHKYEELYNDYNMKECVLPLDNVEYALSLINDFLKKEKNMEIRNSLTKQLPHIKEETHKMWKVVWSC